MKTAKSRNKSWSKGLLALTLFVGLFAFSGNAGSPCSYEKQSPKTELVAAVKANAKRAIPYFKTFRPSPEGCLSNGGPSAVLVLSHVHDRQVKSTLDHSRQCCFRSGSFRFFHRRTFPRNTDEYLAFSSRG